MIARSPVLRSPSFGLLLSLAALILLEPFAEPLRGGVAVLAALHLGVLGLAVRWVSRTRGRRLATWVLVLPAVALTLAELFVEHLALSIANLAMLAVFYAYVIRCLLEYVLLDAIVTVDELFAATCTYVLMAMWFACLYTIQEQLAPGSFAISAASAPHGALLYWDLLYFSFTVLTSTGFGDIHPLARAPRAVVMIQQVAGVMYVAILIARLTGMTLDRKTPRAT
jgi:hypothetical protein